jgi:hypothetical protein
MNTWDRYRSILRKSDVQVFGIADYFSIDGCVAECWNIAISISNRQKASTPNIGKRAS